MTKYELAYRLIPYLLDEFNKGNLRQVGLLDESFIRSYISEDAEFNRNDLIIEHKILTKTKSVGIYYFPEPQKMPEAKYGLVFFNFKKKTTTYYTLEKSNTSKDGTEKWMIGLNATLGQHSNLGAFEHEPIMDIFLNYVYNKFEKNVDIRIIFYILIGLAVVVFLFLLLK